MRCDGPMLSGTRDTSAVTRLGIPQIAERLTPLLEAGLVARCTPTDLEAGFSSPSPKLHLAMRKERWSGLSPRSTSPPSTVPSHCRTPSLLAVSSEGQDRRPPDSGSGRGRGPGRAALRPRLRPHRHCHPPTRRVDPARRERLLTPSSDRHHPGVPGRCFVDERRSMGGAGALRWDPGDGEMRLLLEGASPRGPAHETPTHDPPRRPSVSPQCQTCAVIRLRHDVVATEPDALLDWYQDRVNVRRGPDY